MTRVNSRLTQEISQLKQENVRLQRETSQLKQEAEAKKKKQAQLLQKQRRVSYILHREETETGLPKNDFVEKLDVLENQREVLVQYSSGNVYLLDIISGRQMQSFGQVNFDDQRKALAQPLAVTTWCSVECTFGCVTVNLDFPQVFGCEVYASDAGFAAFGPEYDEQKLNVGLRVCRSLFRCSCVLVLVVPPWRCTPLRRPGERVGVMPRALRLRQTAARAGWARERLASAACALLLACLLLPSALTMQGWWVDAGADSAKMAAQGGAMGGTPTRTTRNSMSAWTTTFLSPSVSS